MFTTFDFGLVYGFLWSKDCILVSWIEQQILRMWGFAVRIFYK